MQKLDLSNENNGCLEWDAILDKDNPDTVILKEGDYNFKVASFTRARFVGSDKIPPCNKASLVLLVATTDGKEVKVKVELLMHTMVSWKVSAFFRSIGQKKRGEAASMNWNAVQGAVGRAHFKPRTYKAANGDERTVNNVAYFIDYDENYFLDSPDFFVEVDELPF